MVRIATFNVENLFARYKFKKDEEVHSDEGGFTINQLAFDIYNDVEKRITAQAIKAVNADILALQEVESLPTLDKFCSQYLADPKYRYTHRIVIDANDPRYIDVAILTKEKYPITSIRTHRHERIPNGKGSSPLFSRDCLEVQVKIGDKELTVYVNHFKSMVGGRKETRERRVQQVSRVRELLDTGPWKESLKGNFVVLGDFNDYVDGDADEVTSLRPLLDDPLLVNVVRRVPPDEAWTHYYAKAGEYRQLDYLLLPEALDEKQNRPLPQFERRGLPYRAIAVPGPRFDDVGEDNPKASDHCPLFVDLNPELFL